VAKEDVDLVVDRVQLSDALARIGKVMRPKAKDAAIRKVVYCVPVREEDGEDHLDLYGTTEAISILSRGLPCRIRNPIPPFAVDLSVLTKFSAVSGGNEVGFIVDPASPKIYLFRGTAKMQVAYMLGEDYQEYLGSDDPTASPDMAEAVDIRDLPTFRGLLDIMAECSDPNRPYLDGVFTDGDGQWMSTDGFRGLILTMDDPDYKWGVKALIPAEFLNAISILPGKVARILWADTYLWATDADDSTVIRSVVHSASGDHFPAETLLSVVRRAEENNVLAATISVAELDAALAQAQSFFGTDALCTVKFGKTKMVLSVEGENQDMIRDSVAYAPADGSEPLRGFDFRIKLPVLGILSKLYDGDFVLRFQDASHPILSDAKSLGMTVILTPYHKQVPTADEE